MVMLSPAGSVPMLRFTLPATILGLTSIGLVLAAWLIVAALAPDSLRLRAERFCVFTRGAFVAMTAGFSEANSGILIASARPPTLSGVACAALAKVEFCFISGSLSRAFGLVGR